MLHRRAPSVCIYLILFFNELVRQGIFNRPYGLPTFMVALREEYLG